MLLLGVFVGCQDEMVDTGTGAEKAQSISLSSKIELDARTYSGGLARLQDVQLVAGRELSLFITETGDLNTALYNNVKITSDGNGNFTHQAMFYPMSGNNIDFFAVHPYASAASLDNELSVTIASDQASDNNYLQSDLLYASKANVVRSKNSVLLNFAHKLSKLEFTIKKGDEAELTDLSKVSVLGVKPSTSINLTNGALGAATGAATDVVVRGVRGAAAGETELGGMDAIIVPQTIAQGVKLFEIKIGTVNYYYQTTEALSFLEGKKYNLQLTIKQTGIEITSVITDWTDGGTIEGDGNAE